MTIEVDGDIAEIHANAPDIYWVFVRILGPKKNLNELKICRNNLDHTDECLLGLAELDRNGVDRMTFATKLFDAALEGELWHLEQRPISESPKFVQSTSGHDSFRTAKDVYANILPSMLREAADTMGAFPEG